MVPAPPRVLPRSLAPSGVLGGGRSGPGSPLLGLGLWGRRQGVPGGVPSTVAWGVWSLALLLPRLPAHWLGCRGPRRGRGRAGVGALLCPCGGCAPRGGSMAFLCWGAGWGGGGGGACAVSSGCAAGAGPVGRGVALPPSVPLPSLGRQQSGRRWPCAVHGGRGPPYHSGSCSPGFSGYDLCGVPVRRRGPACSSRPPCEPAAGAGGRVTLRLPTRAGGGHAPCLGGWGPGGGGVSRRGPPASGDGSEMWSESMRAKRWGCRSMAWRLSFGERIGAAFDGAAAQSVAQMAMEEFDTTSANVGFPPGLGLRRQGGKQRQRRSNEVLAIVQRGCCFLLVRLKSWKKGAIEVFARERS